MLDQRFRDRRMETFLHLMERVPRPATLLDVGGTSAFWRGRLPEGVSLTLINVDDQEPPAGGCALVGDACDLSRFADRSFDVVFSNSVLGHVGQLERQMRMAEEVRRVGVRYFLQTPNQGFPIDWRTMAPCFHWLRPSAQAWCLQRMRVGRYGRVCDADEAMHLATRVRNVSRSELRAMFPDAVMAPERVLGLAKSFVVHHGFV